MLEFLVPVSAVSLDFGEDAGDSRVTSFPARLRGFAGGVEVALAQREPQPAHRSDAGIAPGVTMDRAVFTFTQMPGMLALGTLAALIRVRRRMA